MIEVGSPEARRAGFAAPLHHLRSRCANNSPVSATKLQQLFWPDLQHLSDGEQQVKGNGSADVGRFDGAHMLAADAHPLGQLLLGQPGVLAIICDIVAQFDKLFRMIKAVFSLFAHNAHLMNIVSWIKIS